MTSALRTGISPFYRLARFASHVFLTVWNRYQVEGREHLPASGPAILVANHQSFLDISIVACVSRRRHIAFVARATLGRNFVMAFIMKHTRAVLIERAASDRAAMREILGHLKAGGLVGLFPAIGSLWEF